MLLALISIVVVIFICVEFESVRNFVAKIFFGTLAVAILVYGACALQNAARAEELPKGFYYRVVFLDGDIEKYSVKEVKDKMETTYFIHGNDMDHIWDYYEIKEEDEIWIFNNELSVIAKKFIDLNSLWYEENITNRIILGRIVVLTMWECDPINPFDDEVVDSYFSEYITNIK